MAVKCKLIVHAGWHDRAYCPVSAELPMGYSKCRSVRLRDTRTQGHTPCQVAKLEGAVIISWLGNVLKARTSQRLTAKGVARRGKVGERFIDFIAPPAVTVEQDPARGY